MANTKTQKVITMSKTKSTNILNWIVDEVHWKVLSEEIDLSKTTTFRLKNNLKEKSKESTPFDALAEVLTLKQLNKIIELFNDSIEHPEKYEISRKKKDVDIEKQKTIVGNHLKDMNMQYSERQDKTEKNSNEGEKGDV